MSFAAVLTMDGDDYDVRLSDLVFKRSIDDRGRPSSSLISGLYNLKMEYPEKDLFLEWMTRPNSRKNLEITVKKIDDDSTLTKIKLNKAYCLDYSIHFSNHGETYMNLTLTISAGEISVGNAKIDKAWET